ncbi:D-2-hydroxyacid dehydrogenase [Paenibacillus hamazuiensis]|uniref:D-2-hydroxyacid dehydrogenase n=1 Tax=Paenibacillus hamazuiensis TaxID=2936508 RepID=UPI00200CCABD|nr:D-2-hydroxyacid dehydrogenase [Paenibacillus hamazuiensis]
MRPIKAVLYAEQAMEYYDKLPSLPAAIQVIPCTTEQSAVREVRESDVLCCTGMFFPEAVFSAGTRLELLHSISVGMEPLLCPALRESGVMLTNSRGANAKPVAEHAIALLLALTRNIHLSVRAQTGKTWRRSELRSAVEVEGLTLGLVGFGAIGREIAQKALHLGMKVIAVKRSVSLADRLDQPDGVSLLPMDKLHRMLPEADAVIVCAPLTAQTRTLIGKTELGLMRPTAYIINISRGAVIDEEALIDALREERIAGAGLDVFSAHPLPEESPLWELPQVIATPYISAASPHTMQRAMTIFADNLIRLSCGMPLLNVVDKEAGY